MFVHNLNPVLLKIGFLEIRWYGLFYVIGFLFTLWWLNYLRKKGRLKLNSNEISDLIVWLIVGVIIGARLFEVLVWNPGYYLADPIKVLYFWRGGLSFHGGLVGAVVAAYLFCRKVKKVTFLQLGDFLMVPAAIGTGLGRIGNFINGELPGRITEVAWCVKFPGYSDCRHPQMIYSAIGRFFIAGMLVWLDKSKKHGYLFGLGLLLFGIERLIVDVWREDVLYFFLTTGQWLSIPLIVVGVYLVFREAKE